MISNVTTHTRAHAHPQHRQSRYIFAYAAVEWKLVIGEGDQTLMIGRSALPYFYGNKFLMLSWAAASLSR